MFFALLMVVLAFTPFAPDGGSTLAERVADRYARDVHGIMTFVVTTQTELHAGPIHRSGTSDTAYAVVDGTPIRKRTIRSIDDGKPAGAAALASFSADPEGPYSRFGMRAPFAPNALADYKFQPPVTTGTSIQIAFATTIRDAVHGDGTMSVDSASGRLISAVLHPAVLPPHATAGTITISFGATSPEHYDIVRIVREFPGREGFISGHVTVTSEYRQYRDAATPSAAIGALATMTAPT